MTDRFEAILDESVSALQAGVPIDEILVEVPEYATELRPLLYAAMLLADPKPELVPEERKAALHAEYMAQAAELPPIQPGFFDKVRAVSRVIKKRLTPKTVLNDLVTVTITIILTLAMAVLVLGYVAQDTIPGDFLYGVKQISENVQLFLTFDELRKQELEDEFNTRRLEEIDRLVDEQRAAVVHFMGTIETGSENLWVIEGHTIFLPADVYTEGNPQEGDKVEVVGFLRSNNVLVADTIKSIE